MKGEKTSSNADILKWCFPNAGSDTEKKVFELHCLAQPLCRTQPGSGPRGASGQWPQMWRTITVTRYRRQEITPGSQSTLSLRTRFQEIVCPSVCVCVCVHIYGYIYIYTYIASLAFFEWFVLKKMLKIPDTCRPRLSSGLYMHTQTNICIHTQIHK